MPAQTRNGDFPQTVFVLRSLCVTKTTIQAELPPELTARALAFVEEGWVSDFNELLADALRRFLESHSARVT